MSRTDAHTPFRVRVGEPHRSNDKAPPLYGTLAWLQWWQTRSELPWHELEKCWGRYGDWDHRKVQSRKVRYGARREIREQLDERED